MQLSLSEALGSNNSWPTVLTLGTSPCSRWINPPPVATKHDDNKDILQNSRHKWDLDSLRRVAELPTTILKLAGLYKETYICGDGKKLEVQGRIGLMITENVAKSLEADGVLLSDKSKKPFQGEEVSYRFQYPLIKNDLEMKGYYEAFRFNAVTGKMDGPTGYEWVGGGEMVTMTLTEAERTIGEATTSDFLAVMIFLDQVRTELGIDNGLFEQESQAIINHGGFLKAMEFWLQRDRLDGDFRCGGTEDIEEKKTAMIEQTVDAFDNGGPPMPESPKPQPCGVSPLLWGTNTLPTQLFEVMQLLMCVHSTGSDGGYRQKCPDSEMPNSEDSEKRIRFVNDWFTSFKFMSNNAISTRDLKWRQYLHVISIFSVKWERLLALGRHPCQIGDLSDGADDEGTRRVKIRRRDPIIWNNKRAQLLHALQRNSGGHTEFYKKSEQSAP